MILDIIRLDNFGRGIGYDSNKICFVWNAVPGDRVSCTLLKETSKYKEAIVDEVLKAGDDRITSICPSFALCGGCQFQCYSYKKECEYKEMKVKSLVDRELHLDSSIVKPIVYQQKDFYRNKIVLHGSNGKLGFYQNKSKDLIPIDSCYLLAEPFQKIISALDKYSAIHEVMIRFSNDLLECMISIQGEEDYHDLLSVCDVLIVNGECFSKKNRIRTSIGNYSYYLSHDSFFQVNRFLTTKLYDEVYDVVKTYKPSYVLDLYCGIGSIGLYVSTLCDKVVGIDSNPSNIEDAIKNKELNKANNISFICDKVENSISSFSNVDFIIVDPPRAGLDSKTISYLLKISPNYIVYVSCDPVTMIRDLKILVDEYNIISIKPFNMFPRTYHCESITVLERR